MKIEYKKGDLFKTSHRVIAHGCNAQGVMGSGVARIIRERYPSAYEEYRKAYERGVLKLGTITVSTSPSEKHTIVNCVTQDFFGRSSSTVYVSYDGLKTSMQKLNTFLRVNNYTTVALPMIGAGLGGGDWNIIAPIIEKELTSATPVVYYL